MLYSTLMLMMSSAFLMLRLTPGGSFPRPLSEAEERKYLDACSLNATCGWWRTSSKNTTRTMTTRTT